MEIIHAPVERDEDEIEQAMHMDFPGTWHGDLMARLRDLHPARLNGPSSTQIAIDAIGFLSGHSVRWIHGHYPNGTPRTTIYKNAPSSPTPSETEWLLMVSIVRYPKRTETNLMCWAHISARLETRIVLGNGYTLVLRPGVDHDMAFDADNPACFASFVATAPNEVSDAVPVAYSPENDVSVSVQEDDLTLTVRVYTRSITVPIPPFAHRVFAQNTSFAFDGMRILERLVPVLKK